MVGEVMVMRKGVVVLMVGGKWIVVGVLQLFLGDFNGFVVLSRLLVGWFVSFLNKFE